MPEKRTESVDVEARLAVLELAVAELAGALFATQLRPHTWALVRGLETRSGAHADQVRAAARPV